MPPWPKAKDDTSTIKISAAITLLLFLVILIAITPLLSRRAGCGPGLRLWHCDYNGAVRIAQILVGDALHILLSNGCCLVESSIDQSRLVVIDRVLAQTYCAGQ